ncbi:FAD-binding protein [Crocosphaera watsonii]|uniref:UDP-N-acetylenolpyruvoylglucosamine reductase n=3 Tax=Crocosphaera watsonii TaxID=263511 RepID=T2JQA8_CROWT|nr:FAD-binding protein [Crocosphaera watsonii]CCQ68048.1 UDP-N-acetylenolpyruvoylglucosamine reductase [Crocosphaera watsonii WH 0402]
MVNLKMLSICSKTTKDLSFYRTVHNFQHYSEISNFSEFYDYFQWSKDNAIKIYIVGNGSNTLFTKKNIKSLVLKNKLPNKIEVLSEGNILVSSSVLIIDILKYCYESSFDSFYYLASVPATVGGALAMNAGRGRHHNLSIYDFVESVTFFDAEDNQIKTMDKTQIVKGYRETIFTGLTSKLILNATFKFVPKELDSNPIIERRKWSKEFQDYSVPNCGSVFKECDFKILEKLKGLCISQSCFSSKSINWIINRSQDSKPIVLLIKIAQFLHLLKFRKAILEIITVE